MTALTPRSFSCRVPVTDRNRYRANIGYHVLTLSGAQLNRIKAKRWRLWTASCTDLPCCRADRPLQPRPHLFIDNSVYRCDDEPQPATIKTFRR